MEKIISIAADLGASGGKMAKGYFDGEKLTFSVIHNFINTPVETPNALYWDIFALYQNVITGISMNAGKSEKIESIAIDTWGASYGLLDKRGRLLEPVYHYRDSRTSGSIEEIYKIVDKKHVFQMTGCQCNRTYTLPQLYSYIEQDSKILDSASKMLFLPDLLEYFLSGEISTEMTIAGTSALMNKEQENWCYPLFKRLSLPIHMLTDIVDAGSRKGYLLKNISEKTGAGKVQVIAATGHDSASAVAAIPGFGENKLYISVGTNISMGIESATSIVTEKSFGCGFKNTGGFNRKKILYRDFPAFWLINELRRIWETEGKKYSFHDIIKIAEESNSRHVYVDIEEPEFNNAKGDMRVKINNYLQKTNQKFPETDGEYVLCIFESIAMKIKYYAGLLKNQLHVFCSEVFVINGGTRNQLLMQIISDALGMEIKTGMPYATLVGNILTQLYALGKVRTIDEMRELSKQSFTMRIYEPENHKLWDEEIQKMTEKGMNGGQS